MRGAAHSIVVCNARLKRGSNVLIICGRHNKGFAEELMLECYARHAFPHLWMFDGDLAKKARATIGNVEAKLPRHTRSLLEQSDVIIWLTQFENPRPYQPNSEQTFAPFGIESPIL